MQFSHLNVLYILHIDRFVSYLDEVYMMLQNIAKLQNSTCKFLTTDLATQKLTYQNNYLMDCYLN